MSKIKYAYCSRHNCYFKSPNGDEPCPSCEAGHPKAQAVFWNDDFMVNLKVTTSEEDDDK